MLQGAASAVAISGDGQKLTRRSLELTGTGWAQAFEVRGRPRWLYVSGQTPADEAGKAPKGALAQARAVWENIRRRLAAADMSLNDIVKMTIFLSDRAHIHDAYQARREALGDHAPAMTIVICSIYDPDWLLEIEVVAAA